MRSFRDVHGSAPVTGFFVQDESLLRTDWSALKNGGCNMAAAINVQLFTDVTELNAGGSVEHKAHGAVGVVFAQVGHRATKPGAIKPWHGY